MFKFLSVLLFVSAVAKPVQRATDLFELSVLHINDFHARFEETNDSGGTCKETDVCIGGFSRLYKELRTILDGKPDAVLLNGGDNFQGTLWYTVGKWNVTQQFLNKLPFDATVLGNHEFDDKIAGVVPFLESLNHPVVASNIDDSLEPTIQGLYNKSTVIERNGKKIGIIGVILHNCNEIASTGDLKFYMESPSVNEEAERLVREEGVFTNIVVSHSGYETEIEIAKNASEKISLIVGGHSHSFLYTGDDSPGPDTPQGPYPTIVTSKNGKTVLVTQASAYCKYLGNITVFLDEDGEIADYSGAPIFLSNDYPQDEEINQEMQPWKDVIDVLGEQVIGSTLVTLSRSNCRYAECTLGDFVTDAMVYSWMDEAEEGSWTYAAIGIMNSGGLRTDIQVGDITYADMVTAQPFENTFDVGELQGIYIKELLEYNTLPYSYGRVYVSLKLMQFSGIQVVMNLTQPQGERVQSVKVRCQACMVPVYEDLDENKMYRIVVPSFITTGGDGYTIISDNLQNLKVGSVDIDVFVKYLSEKSPVYQEEEGRITIYGQETIVMKNLDS
ncbi:apyrase [Anoplophora glabripennis]|nr:apyrase [Anoplophora glabripennis]